ncbi:MAG: HD domain-containing protein [Peptococcaceae bacterium]|nr:HD domain-containing protein [Peptococcaceae bacterium]
MCLKDEYLIVHQENVAQIAWGIAKQVCPWLAKSVYIAGLNHDIGKIVVPDSILFKAGELSAEEWEVVRLHPVVSEELVTRIAMLFTLSDADWETVRLAIRFHHERWNGKGYPYGLKKSQIPVAARIIAVADSYHAMITDRAYRKGLSVQKALGEIERGAGVLYDPAVVDAAVEYIIKKEEDNALRIGYRPRIWLCEGAKPGQQSVYRPVPGGFGQEDVPGRDIRPQRGRQRLARES